jgi:hypothetical protein
VRARAVARAFVRAVVGGSSVLANH